MPTQPEVVQQPEVEQQPEVKQQPEMSRPACLTTRCSTGKEAPKALLQMLPAADGFYVPTLPLI
jgi:hypothetical protein